MDNKLVLKHGPLLTFSHWSYDEEIEEGGIVADDVTDQAGSYLFKKVIVSSDVLLSDLFKLLQLNPVLIEVYHSHWIQDFLDEAAALDFKGNDVVEDDEAIEYLEIEQQWSHDCDSNTMAYMRNDLHGVGFIRKKDNEELHEKAGTCTTWSLSFIPLKDLLQLPLRINPLVKVVEDNNYSTHSGQIKDTFLQPNLQLGELLEAVFFELSFYGSPAHRDEQGKELIERREEIDKGTIETTLWDSSVLYKGNKQVFALYKEDYDERMLWELLRKLPDNENAQVSLNSIAGDQFQLKDEYKMLSGLKLRAAVGDLTKDNVIFEAVN